MKLIYHRKRLIGKGFVDWTLKAANAPVVAGGRRKLTIQSDSRSPERIEELPSEGKLISSPGKRCRRLPDIKCFQISVIRLTRNQVRVHIHYRWSPNSGTSTPPMIPAGSCGGAGR